MDVSGEWHRGHRVRLEGDRLIVEEDSDPRLPYIPRTPADSTAVDAREYRVLDTRLSCEWLFANWPDLMHDPIATERALLALLGLAGVFAGTHVLDKVIPNPQE